MDRFIWTDGSLAEDEQLVTQQNSVRLYDGENKTSFDHGKTSLTTHRLVWRDQRDQKSVISLALSLVVYTEEQSAGFAKSAKIVVHLSPRPDNRPPGPVQSSSNSYVRLSFKDGGETEFHRCMAETLSRKKWQTHTPSSTGGATGGMAQTRQLRMGIGGIEKSLAKKHQDTDKNISVAFEDMNKLMDKAKEMVNLSKIISQKIKEKQGDITEDETIKFKSYLLSLGIPDPVTRGTHGTGDKYNRELAKQLASIMEQPLAECGGMMTLSDVYCRVNRARGMELLSPEDLVNGCRAMEVLHLPVRLRIFDSGVMVLHLQSHSEAQVVKETAQMFEEKVSVTADELARLIGLSVVLCKERLLSTEQAGKICRDETTEGLRFYPNWFVTKQAS